MKFIIQLVANILRAVLTSSKKLLSHHKLNFVDVCVFCTTVFLAAGYYYPWCLIVAFVCMLPPLQEQLYLPEDDRAPGEGNDGKEMTLEEQLQSKIQIEEEALARELAGGVEEEKQPVAASTPDTNRKLARGMSSPESAKSGKRKDKKEKDKKQQQQPPARTGKGKAQWGLPTLRVKDSQGRIIEINSEKPVEVETEYFKGTILMMLRTDGDLEEFNRYEHHFSGKQRKFEVQFQVRTGREFGKELVCVVMCLAGSGSGLWLEPDLPLIMY
jgi:hypothetical protein